MDRRPLILFFSNFFRRPPEIPRCCPDRCEFTTDHRRLAEADAVVVHLPSPGPLRRLWKYPGQLWVAWSLESRLTHPLLADADFMRHFDIVMSYEQGADIWCPYLPDPHEFEAAVRRPLPAKPETAPAALFMSANTDVCGRTDFARELMKQMRIDSYGRKLNTRRLDGTDEGALTKLATIARYKFSLAFENSVAPDYVSEKFFQPLLAGTVPVYRGAPNVAEYAPGDTCYIDANDFAGPRELAEYLTNLASDESAYRRHLAWREAPLRRSFLEMMERAPREPFCTLGDLVSAHPRERRRWWSRFTAEKPLARFRRLT